MKTSKSRLKLISKRSFYWRRFALSACTLLLLKMSNFSYFLSFRLSASIYTIIQLIFLFTDLYHLLVFLHLIAVMAPRRAKKIKITHSKLEAKI